MIRLLLLRWKRVAASMDKHIKAVDLTPTRTPAQLQPAPGLVSYKLCCRLLERTNYYYNNIFRITEKTPHKIIKGHMIKVNSTKHGSQEDEAQKYI